MNIKEEKIINYYIDNIVHVEINESKQTYEIHFHEKYFDGGLDITLDGVKELITVLQMTVNKMEEIFNQEDKTLDI